MGRSWRHAGLLVGLLDLDGVVVTMGDAADDLREQEEQAELESIAHRFGKCDPLACPVCLQELEAHLAAHPHWQYDGKGP